MTISRKAPGVFAAVAAVALAGSAAMAQNQGGPLANQGLSGEQINVSNNSVNGSNTLTSALFGVLSGATDTTTTTTTTTTTSTTTTTTTGTTGTR